MQLDDKPSLSVCRLPEKQCSIARREIYSE